MTTADGCPITGATTDSSGPLTFPFDPPSALEPPPEWAELREACPVSRVRTVAGEDALLLTRYGDVKSLLADPRFTRTPGGEDADRTGSSPSSGTPESIMLGDGHLRWRRLLSRSFTVKRMRALQPAIREVADDLIDAMLDHGREADLRSALGFPLPVYVICDLLGVPAADRDDFARWSDHMLNLTRYSEEQVVTAAAELDAYLVGHVRAKRAAPGEDLLSELTAVADSDDGRLSEEELVATGKALLIAGHETTANMIGKMMSMLLSRRERWEQLVADPSLVRSAVEEVLRFDANLGFAMHRWVTEEIRIGDVVVEPRTMVLSSMPSANRDESVFTDAGDMDLSRTPNPHVTFGVGPHSCLGQSLARIELQTVLAALIERVPDLELAVPEADLRRREGLLVGGLEEVPVRW